MGSSLSVAINHELRQDRMTALQVGALQAAEPRGDPFPFPGRIGVDAPCRSLQFGAHKVNECISLRVHWRVGGRQLFSSRAGDQGTTFLFIFPSYKVVWEAFKQRPYRATRSSFHWSWAPDQGDASPHREGKPENLYKRPSPRRPAGTQANTKFMDNTEMKTSCTRGQVYIKFKFFFFPRFFSLSV